MAHNIASFWRGMWRDAGRDIKVIATRKSLYSLALFVWISGLLILSVILGRITDFVSSADSSCTPDGIFQLFPDRYSYWGRSGFFQINLGYGQLSFGMAKFVDIAWDVVFGRGGQAVLALCSWRVFALYVTTSMETAPITYESFKAIFIQGGPTVFSTYSLFRDFAFRKGLQSKLAMVFMLLSMIYTLAFPTLAGAMSGYVGYVNGFVPDRDNNNFIRFDQYRRVLYVIHDGDRVGQSADFIVDEGLGVGDPIFSNPLTTVKNTCQAKRYLASQGFDDTSWSASTLTMSPVECYMSNNVSLYVQEFGFSGALDTISTFMNFTLDPPTLNISAFYANDPTLVGPSSAAMDVSLWAWSNETYNYTYVASQGSCQPTGDYQWGFSFIQLFVMVICILLWSIGILIMYTQARSTLRRRGRETISGEKKALLDIAFAMHKELGTDTLDLHLLTEAEIRERIKDADGGSMSYLSPILFEPKETKINFTAWSAWFKREKWWLLATFLCVAVAATIWLPTSYIVSYRGPSLFYLGLYTWLAGSAAGFVFSLCIGTTGRSRMLFILVWSILSAIPLIVISIMSSAGVLQP